MVALRAGRMGRGAALRRRHAAWRHVSEQYWRRPNGMYGAAHCGQGIVALSLRTAGPVVGAAGLVGGVEAVAARLADLVAAAFVFVVRGDVTDGFVEAGRVVVGAYAFELGAEHGWVGDGEQVRVLGFDMAP